MTSTVVTGLKPELADSLDEDYELELSEPALSMEIGKVYRKGGPSPTDPAARLLPRPSCASSRADQAPKLGLISPRKDW